MFREEYYHVIAVVLGVGAFLLVTPFEPNAWRVWWLSCVEFLSVGGGLPIIYGGTFIASNGAKAIAAANPTANNIALPVTDSK